MTGARVLRKARLSSLRLGFRHIALVRGGAGDAGSGDELAAGAGDHNRLRASDADREQVAEVLKTAFVQGRLTMDEFALRVTRVYASRTYADLDALTADVPAPLTKAQPPKPAQGPDPDGRKLIRRGTAVGAGAGVVIPAVIIAAAGGSPLFALVFGVLLSSVLAVLLPGFLTLLSRFLDRDTGGQRSQGPPGVHGKAYQPLPLADPTRSRPQISPEPPHAAEARRNRRPRLTETARPSLSQASWHKSPPTLSAMVKACAAALP